MVWREKPLKSVILEILNKRKVILSNKLIELVEQRIPDVSESMVFKVLMSLEINRVISVTPVNKKQKKIELIMNQYF